MFRLPSTLQVSLVEMSAARLRALTRISKGFGNNLNACRNECGPFEGIDTVNNVLGCFFYEL